MSTHDVQSPVGRNLPWGSIASLAYPAGAAIYAASSGAPFIAAVGYGLANLGYLLLAAGVFAGTFKVFCLTKRWQVLSSAAFAFGVGTLLSNVA